MGGGREGGNGRKGGARGARSGGGRRYRTVCNCEHARASSDYEDVFCAKEIRTRWRQMLRVNCGCGEGQGSASI